MNFPHTNLYKKGYQSDLIRGIDEPRPWNLTAEILRFANLHHTMLDIGSGSASKLLPLSKHFNKIIALEPSHEMRELAQETITNNKTTNIEIIEGYANNLPFQDNTFELVTCMLAPCDIDEVFRVLKPGGIFINETIGAADKIEFKKEFGKDEQNNWRGQFLQFTPEDFIKFQQENYQKKFSDIKIENGFWATYYTKQGLIELCQHTPTIKNFALTKDEEYLNKAIAKCTTDKGIKLIQNRLLITAKKNPIN